MVFSGVIQYANCFFFPPVNQKMIAPAECSDSDPVSCSQKKVKKRKEKFSCVSRHTSEIRPVTMALKNVQQMSFNEVSKVVLKLLFITA